MQCPVCEKEDVFNLIETWKEYKLYHCRKCDVVFSHPMKNPGSEWYEESELYILGKTLCDTTISWHHDQFIHDGKVFGDSLLDVGCGNGVFMKEAQKLGYKVVGIDFDKENIRIAREQFGLNEVFSITLENLIDSYPNKKFDVITFFEVLEHMDSPNNFIKLIKTGLKPGGYIALSVPNRERFLDPLGDGDYPPNHLTRWNASSISSFLEKRGFEIIKVTTKKLTTDDLIGYIKTKIRFRIAHKLILKGKTHNDQAIIHRAATLMKIKDTALKLVTIPLAPILSLLKLQGGGLYCLARLKPVVTLSKEKGNL
ncbi:MAG: methyltransferase domain-containing protein [Nitrospinae bacterium]|nr:methyltransferase domain-containing protein [Nitrospinota bacterium]